ncbi:DUF6179 domain-containing protein [Halocella sp. SP3-1]|uniref:DUF6179 domain-containing protein n=1 Tax=Halocella sp. SP3-1 TaxID=2382161 RepID=UPI000F75723E|nr:DUF6179 domain-containing protein [Halocella sp. SP3-1]AZO95740.1 hypothetical protein D7D81_14735 [Halocella sp. SP3-1]
MHNKIVTISKLKKENINKYHYTLSLLLEGQRKGLINKKTINSIHQQIIVILRELILKYTKGNSTSVKVETAENIQKSILYVIDFKLASYSNPEKSLFIIKKTDVKKIYEEGIILLKRIIEDAENLYAYIKENKLKIPLEVYNSTIEEALPVFFASYDINYNAHNTVTYVDYPLVFNDLKMQGIIYINDYLKNLNLETNFCGHFNINDIKNVLNNYGHLYNIDYRQTPINIFEIVINNSIFSAILSNNITDLNISESQYKILKGIFTQSTAYENKVIINEAINKIIAKLKNKDKNLINYIRQYKPLLITKILNTIKNDSLHNLIITDNTGVKKEKIVFSSSKSMSNDIFRSLVEKIRNSSDTADKITIITSKVKSMDDLIDILSADCLYADEFKELYKQISNVELAVLAKMIFLEEIRAGQFHLAGLIVNEDFDEEWQQQYVEFILELSKIQQRKIEQLIDKIEL